MAKGRKEESAIARIQDAYPVLAGGGDVSQALLDNLGGEALTEFDMPRVRVPGSGGLTWEVPNPEDEGNPSSTRELDGIVVYTKMGRSYWSQGLEDSGGGSPPDCSSPDGVRGFGDPGGPCEECPLSQWGSDDGGSRGQACKQQRFVFLLREGDSLPTVLVLPPTSLGPMKKFLLSISQRGLRYWDVVTRFQLRKAQNRGGIVYAQVSPSVLRVLTQEERAVVTPFAALQKATFRGYRDGAAAPAHADDAGSDYEPYGEPAAAV